MKVARPVRLADITRIGTANGHTPEWQDLSEDCFVHDYLTDWGAYAVYEGTRRTYMCLVGLRSRD